MKSAVAVQMYTVRDYTHTELALAESLRKIASIGYRAVQLSAIGAMSGSSPTVSALGARNMLHDYGLKCIATHRSWGELVNRTDDEIEFHKTLGCGFTAIGGLPADYAAEGAEGYARFVDDAVAVAARLNEAGIQFGYHNHAHEFQRQASGRSTLYDILIERGGLDLCLEIDVYWVQHAGVDPVRVVERCRGRMPVIHLKDKEVLSIEGPVMAPIGEGNLDWNAILPACDAAGAEWFCVEQDVCRRDPFDCLASSFRFLRECGAGV